MLYDFMAPEHDSVEQLESDVNRFLAYVEDCEYLAHRAGIYDRVYELAHDRAVDGEVVSGLWIMETAKALQCAAGIPGHCVR